MAAPFHSENPNDFDSQNPTNESEYVPEREFVLMPLFRHIGQMLGLRVREQEAVFAEPTTGEALIQTREIAQAEASSPSYEETPEPPFPVEASQNETSDVLGLEEHEHSFGTVHEDEASAPPPAAEPENIPLEHPAFAQEEPAEAAIPTPSAPPSTFEPADVVIALREATAKVSSAIERAAEWLRDKEDEILNGEKSSPGKPSATEPSLVPQPVYLDSVETQPPQEAASHTMEEAWPSSREQETRPDETWPGAEIPALQQEMAWREPGPVAPRLPEPQPIAASLPRSSESAVVVRTTPQRTRPRVPIWKQIDWSHEFTPKRVAVIGALVMAALLAIGMSFARRPASTMLPEQSRRLEPGGVTVTAHPRPTPAQPAHNTAQQRQTPASHPSTRHRAPRYDDGPDVVTHYYTHGKPSPVHQSTVAGVRHYSDIE